MSAQLTDSQLVILSAASARTSCSILPLPSSLTLNKGSAALVLKSLISRGLVVEQLAGRADDVWREGEDGARLTLKLTEAAFRALNIEPAEDDAQPACAGEPAGSDVPTGSSPPAGAVQPAPGTKLATILDLLRQDRGATLDEIIAATNWQAHSIRGAISGSIKKKLGLPVETVLVDGRGRVYRLASTLSPSSLGEDAQ
jgi:hypothetical protein